MYSRPDMTFLTCVPLIMLSSVVAGRPTLRPLEIQPVRPTHMTLYSVFLSVVSSLINVLYEVSIWRRNNSIYLGYVATFKKTFKENHNMWHNPIIF